MNAPGHEFLMKRTMVITTLLVVIFLIIGWRERLRAAAAKEEHDRALAESRVAGGAGEGAREAVRPPREKSPDARERAKALVSRLISAARPPVSGRMYSSEEMAARAGSEAELQRLNAAELEMLLEELAANDPGKFLREKVQKMMAENAGRQDPGVVLALCEKLGDPMKQMGLYGASDLIRNAIQRTAARDPGEAAEWLCRNLRLDSFSRYCSSEEVIKEAIKVDPVLAFSMMEKLQMPKTPSVFAQVATAAKEPASQMAMLGRARESAATEPDARKRRDLMEATLCGLAPGVAGRGCESATAWLKTANLTAEETAMFAGSLDGRTTQSSGGADNGKWLHWLSDKLPAGQLDTKVGQWVEKWAKQDYKAAGSWLNEEPEGPVKSAAVASYARTTAPYDPATAGQWALTLPAGDGRRALLEQVHAEWKKQDEAAAAKFAADQGIGR